MALLDFLKKKEEVKKSRKPAKKAGEVKVQSEKTETVKPQPSNNVINAKGFSFDVIKQPHISEKASYLAEKNQYTFDIVAGYNKEEIAKAIAGIYGVDVLSVNIVKIPPKKRRLGKTQGFRKQYIKAIVTIKEGQKIEIL